MKKILRPAAWAACLLCVAAGSSAGIVTLDSVLRYVEADVNTWSAPGPTRIESPDPGIFNQKVWVNNYPSVVSAGVTSEQVSNLLVGPDTLSLSGRFVGDPYWYWHMQSEWYAMGAEIDFTLDGTARFDITMSQTCYYWRAEDGYCPTRDANFSYSLDGRNDYGPGGLLGPGKHRFVVSSWGYDPWNGVQTMNFSFLAEALPMPAPGTLLLTASALGLMVLTRRRQRR